MSYCIMHIAKRHRQDIGGLQREANREMNDGKYHNNVDLAKSKDNIYLIHSDNWYRDIHIKLDKHRIRRVRKDAVMAITGLYSASPDWFKGSTRCDMISYFEDCLKFHECHYGPIISAVVHLDETTPHLHICSVPITPDGRLSAKELVGNRSNMTRLQTRFAIEVGRMYGLQRGEDRSADARHQHKSEQEYAIERNNESIAAQQRAIMQGLRELQDTENRRQELLRDTARIREKLQEAQKSLQQAISCNAQEQLKELTNMVNITLDNLPEKYASAFMDEFNRVFEDFQKTNNVIQEYWKGEDER